VDDIKSLLPEFTSFLLILILSIVSEKGDQLSHSISNKYLKKSFPKDRVFLSHFRTFPDFQGWCFPAQEGGDGQGTRSTYPSAATDAASAARGADRLRRHEDERRHIDEIVGLLPKFEHTLRHLYVRSNKYSIEMLLPSEREHFTHLDEIMDAKSKTQSPNLLFEVVSVELRGVIHDLFIARSGPRLRDRIAHGECELNKVNVPVEYLHILRQVTSRLEAALDQMSKNHEHDEEIKGSSSIGSRIDDDRKKLKPQAEVTAAVPKELPGTETALSTPSLCLSAPAYVPLFDHNSRLARAVHFAGVSIRHLVQYAVRVGSPLRSGVVLRAGGSYQEISPREVIAKVVGHLGERMIQPTRSSFVLQTRLETLKQIRFPEIKGSLQIVTETFANEVVSNCKIRKWTNLFPYILDLRSKDEHVDQELNHHLNKLVTIGLGIEHFNYQLMRRHLRQSSKQRKGSRESASYERLHASLWAFIYAAIMNICSIETFTLRLVTTSMDKGISSEKESKKALLRWGNNISRLSGLIQKSLYADALIESLDHLKAFRK